MFSGSTRKPRPSRSKQQELPSKQRGSGFESLAGHTSRGTTRCLVNFRFGQGPALVRTFGPDTRRSANPACFAIVFLRYYVVVGRRFDDVDKQFANGADSWMPALIQKANGHGMQLLSELGLELGKRKIKRQIELDIGKARRTPGVTLVPIKWRAANDSSLFPALDGQIELAKLGLATTQLGISASYEPPFGTMGKIADRALMHRIAEVTVKDFLERIGERLENGE